MNKLPRRKEIKRIKPPTAQQSVAAEPGRSVWVSANAGTGKTRVLVDRIARLLLAGTRPEKILCLTFTKTGAAEMAKRINEQLGRWALMDEKTLADGVAGGSAARNLSPASRDTRHPANPSPLQKPTTRSSLSSPGSSSWVRSLQACSRRTRISGRLL